MAVHNDSIGSITTVFDELKAQLEALAAEEGRTAEYKQEQENARRAAARARLEEWNSIERDVWADRRERAQALIPLYTPPANEGEARLLDTIRSELTALWKRQEMADIVSVWQDAIKRGDRLTARVFAAHARDYLLERYRLPDTGQWADLESASWQLFDSDEIRTARQTIIDADDTLAALEMEYSAAKVKIEGARFDDRTGAVVDGIEASVHEQVRGMI